MKRKKKYSKLELICDGKIETFVDFFFTKELMQVGVSF